MDFEKVERWRNGDCDVVLASDYDALLLEFKVMRLAYIRLGQAHSLGPEKLKEWVDVARTELEESQR